MTYNDVDKLKLTAELLHPLNIRLEPGIGQIQDMEEFISRTWEPGSELMLPTYFIFGLILAKSVMFDFPQVQWEEPMDKEIEDISKIAIMLPLKGKDGILRMKPVARIINFLSDREDTPTSFYYMVEHILSYDIESDEYRERFVGEDGWVRLSNGTRFRQIVYPR